MIRAGYVCLLTVTIATSAAAQAPADLIVTADRIYTVEPGPHVHAVAISDGRFVYAGTVRGAARYRGPNTRTMDFPGAFIYPGLADAHAHLGGLGTALERVRLDDTRTYEEVVARVVERAGSLPRGEWVLGRGWDQTRWPVKDFPTHDAFSRAVPDHPVAITRVDGHALLANARAMELAGVTAATPDPAGGRIVRDASGRPTGVFIDNAENLINRVIPRATPEQTRRRLLAAAAEVHKWGLTSVHDAGESRSTIDIIESMAAQGEFDLRTYVMISADTADERHYFARGPVNAAHGNRVWIRSIKVYADGALGSRGAALLAPYSDDPGNVGLLVTPPERIQSLVHSALAAGFQVATHAIGDRGNRIALDAYDAGFKQRRARDHRFRVEHAQVISLADIPRFARLGVIPSMQASHQRSDMRWAEERVGPQRIRGAYAWRSLLRSGGVIPNGSDAPVESVNPLISFYAAVTRQDESGYPPGGWYPDQRMTRAEALKAMTIWPAFAGFQESMLGSIKAGKLAYLTVLDRDIMTVPTNAILSANVVATFVGGRQVYSRAAGGQLREAPPPRIHSDPLPPQLTPPSARDSAAVVAAVEGFHAALAAGDSTAALSFLDDGVVVLESGGVETREEYRSHHLASDIAFARAVPGTRSPMRVRIAGDAAWASSTSVTQGTFNGRAINSAGAELMVLRRTTAGWKISAIHWSSRTRRP
ncbi:MAG: amidohydrolase family protein [Gemmatimonadota bacterium]|nr:amidohydrolase family protein [Gemmatimonadota bacterium]